MKKIFSEIFLLVILISLAFIFLDYKGIGYSDTNEFTPLFYRLADSNYLVNDWFINDASSSFNVRLYFIYFIFILSKIFTNISFLYFLLYSLFVILAGASVYWSSKDLFKDEKSSILNVFLVLLGATFSLGGILIFTSNLSSFLVSISLSMLGFYFLLNKRLKLFAIFMGLSSLIHFVSGHIVFGLLFISNFIASKKDKKTIIKQAVALVIFILFSLITLPNLAADKESSLGFSGAELREIVGEIRAPHHYLPLNWPITRYIEFGLFLALFLVALKASKIDNDKRALIIYTTIVLVTLIALNIFFVEVYPTKLFLKLNFFRLTTFFVFIQYLFIGNFIFNKMKKEHENKSLKFFIYPILIFSLLSNHLILLTIPLFFVYLKFENKIKITKKLFYSIILLGAILIILSLFSDKVIRLIYLKKETIIYLLCSIVVLVPLIIHSIFTQKNIRVLATISLILSIMIFTILNYPILNEDYGKYNEVYSFIKEKTPIDAVFLIPPELNSFRLGANRAIVADFKSFPFGEKQMLEWRERMLYISAITNFTENSTPESQIIEGYKQLPKEQILLIKEKYGAEYALFDKPKNIDFEIAYEDENTVLYRL
jgi:hypothetical protein